MKAKDLINALRNYPPEFDVNIHLECTLSGGTYSIKSISSLMHKPNSFKRRMKYKPAIALIPESIK